MIGCDCGVCRSINPRNKRRRVSVLLSEGPRRWLIDAGPDFRAQALDVGLDRLDAVFLTHPHADHILGLDDLRPLSWKNPPLPVWADRLTTDTVARAFPYFFSEGDGKTSRPRLEFRPLEHGKPVEAAGLSVLPLTIRHGDLDIMAFRVGDTAYLTDCNGIPDETRTLLKGIDTLILDALRLKPHPTHYSLSEAIDVAKTIGARQTWFTHFSHDIEHEAISKTLPEGMALAYDGLSFDVHL